MRKPNSNGSGFNQARLSPVSAKTHPSGPPSAPRHSAARHAACLAGQPAGFTLTELLVVSLVIAVLAAFMIPLIRNLRESGLAAKCTSHMRQCAIASMAFTTESNGRLPRLRVPNAIQVPGTPDENSVQSVTVTATPLNGRLFVRIAASE